MRMEKGILKDAVDRINADGDTNIDAGLREGFKVLSDSTTFTARKAAVLLTDGEDVLHRRGKHVDFANVDGLSIQSD